MPGIYIHIPFCLHRCGYCDFCSSLASSEAVENYVKALVKCISGFSVSGIFADTLYFGGGTPSLLEPSQMALIIDTVSQKFPLTSDCEITTEANPGTVDEKKLRAYRFAGINRISFGIQSCKDNELYTLGRIHTFSEALSAIDFAHASGIENVSADLMLGIPHQTLETALESVEKFTDSGITHLSAYMLKIEPGTPFDSPGIRSLLPSDDEVADIYLETVKALDKRGFKQYEISNFSLSGYESRHNIKYWTGEEYLGFGPSAHSYFNGRRFYYPSDIGGFVSDPLKLPETEDSCPDVLEEYIMLGLRMCKGISLDKIRVLGGDPKRVLSVCKKYISAGLMKNSGGNLSLTPEGFLVSNGIISEII